MVGDTTALDGQGSVLGTDKAEAAAIGAGLLGPQAARLLLEKDLQRALVQAVGGGRGDLLHGGEIDAEVGSVVSEGAACHDFSPASGEFVDLTEFYSGDLALGHLQSLLVLASSASSVFPLPLYQTSLCLAKRVLTSVARLPSDGRSGRR